MLSFFFGNESNFAFSGLKFKVIVSTLVFALLVDIWGSVIFFWGVSVGLGCAMVDGDDLISKEFVVNVMFVGSAMEGGVNLVLDMFDLLNFFNGPGDHIHHDEVICNDWGNTSDINGRGIPNSCLLTTNSILNILISLIGDLFVEVADKVIRNLIVHGVQHIAVWPNFEDNDINIAANHNDDNAGVVPVLEFGGGFLVGDQAAHVGHEKEPETLNYRILHVHRLVVRVVLVHVVAYLPQQKYVQYRKKVRNRKLCLRLYHLLTC